MELTVTPLKPECWADFEDLFGKQGACYGCWCTHFRLPPKVRKQNDRDANRAYMKARVEAGPPPGLLAYDRNGAAVGWLQVGPRADVPEWNNSGRVTAPLDDAPASDGGVWAVSCFFVRSAARGQGISHGLLGAAIGFARQNGARLLEACPMDQAKQAKSVGLFVGSTRVFEKAGFREVALRKPGRPLMRLDLDA